MLTRFFTVEYAALFDVMNPALATFDMPVPLGGTSNHFRTGILRGLHGWDAWNVTEDADLGIRLALAGYRVADLPSATLEEAPATVRAWLKQRTRWMKGYMQTCITHGRRPAQALRALGFPRFMGAVTMTFGALLAALGYPFFVVHAIVSFANGTLMRAGTPFEALQAAVGLTLFVAGLFAMMAPAAVAIRHRRLRRCLAYVPLLPLYYVLVSIAAWRGLAELLLDPFRWNKTEHGLARTSRAGLLTDVRSTPARPAQAAGRG
jgi:cellulose synthase/poly-beta-1,6-N-acetylglucosamine synthase-like glycosyltransferase